MGMTDKEQFEKMFSPEYREMLQRKIIDGRIVDISEIMWMVWNVALNSKD